MLIFMIIGYYDLPSDNIPDTKTAAINEGYSSGIENSSDSVPARMKKIEKQTSFVDKLALWKGTSDLLANNFLINLKGDQFLANIIKIMRGKNIISHFDKETV